MNAPEIEIDRSSIGVRLKKGGYYLYFSKRYKLDILALSHVFMVYDKDNTIAEIRAERFTDIAKPSPSETLK